MIRKNRENRRSSNRRYASAYESRRFARRGRRFVEGIEPSLFTYYQIVLNGYDVYDSCDSEDEAIRMAKKLRRDGFYGYDDGDTITVDRVVEFLDENGETVDTEEEQIFEC